MKETFPVETSLDMNSNFIYNVKTTERVDQRVNKKHVDDNARNKVDKSYVDD